MLWRWLPVLVLLTGCRTAKPVVPAAGQQESEEMVGVLDSQADFSGAGLELDPATLTAVKIGLFAPEDDLHPVAGPVYRAVRLAIEEANHAGGYEGLPFQLIVRWDNNPWAGGAREVTRLVYRDSVLAIIGSIDGASTHVAEQITSKTWVPLISPVSADPTLTYINIPWIFRLPPNESEQAGTLVEDGIVKRGLTEVGLITSTDHDGRVFALEIKNRLGIAQLSPLFHLEVDAGNVDLPALLERAASFEADGLVLRLPDSLMTRVLPRLATAGVQAPVFIPWIPGLDVGKLSEAYGHGIFSIHPFSPPTSDAYFAFQDGYFNQYGELPTAAAALSYDAAKLVIEAIGEAGPSRAGIRRALSEASGFQGVSGKIRWDNGGGNMGKGVIGK